MEELFDDRFLFLNHGLHFASGIDVFFEIFKAKFENAHLILKPREFLYDFLLVFQADLTKVGYLLLIEEIEEHLPALALKQWVNFRRFELYFGKNSVKLTRISSLCLRFSHDGLDSQ